MNIQEFRYGQAEAVLVDGVAHVLKRSRSSYGLTINGWRRQYCCQHGCCDQGLQLDVAMLVAMAKEHGATKVVLRIGQRQYYHSTIAGLPVECVSGHTGEIADGICIDQRRH
jgi:hypothetical protein